jgi:hypothetical protein
MMLAGETEYLGKACPSATLPTTHPAWVDSGANPGLRGDRPVTNRLSHGTASINVLLVIHKAMHI